MKPETPVGFIELFYDLIFVASTMVLSNEFSRDPTWQSAGICGLMFMLLWLLWFHTTVLMNIDRRDDLFERALMFVQMFMIFVITLEFVDKKATRYDFVGLGYLLAVLALAMAYHRVSANNSQIRQWATARRNRLLLAGLVMVAGFVIPDGMDYAVYAVAILLLVLPTSVAHSRGLPVTAVDHHHLAERAALLTLIMMGEAFVKVALVVSNGSLSSKDVVAIVVIFVVLFGLFSVYFDDVPKAGMRPGILNGELWLLAHLILQLGIVAFAIGMSKYLQIEDGHVHDYAVIILTAGYFGIFGGLSVIGLLGMRTPRRLLFILRVVTLVLVLLGATAAWSISFVTPAVFVVFLAVLTIVHALIDEYLQRFTTVLMPGNDQPVDNNALEIHVDFSEEN